MASTDKIDKIKRITSKLRPQAPINEPNKDYFESLMKQRRVEPSNTEAVAKDTPEKTLNTLFDEAKTANQIADNSTRSTSKELVVQAEDVIAQIDMLKTKLETPDLEIKNSVQTLLRNKLNHIDDSLKVALEKSGSEYASPEKSAGMSKPIDRFLGLLTHSQNQLSTIAGDVKTMAMSEHELSPANMLLIQIKVHQVQQEIELFTSMLNKALESTKTIMNVQV